MAKYLLSVYQPESDPPPAEELERITCDLAVLHDELRAAGSWVFAGGLHAPTTATVLHPRRSGLPMTDGPYVEAKEYIGGLSIIAVDNLDEALGWARKLADATTLPIEVRPFTDDRPD